MTFEQLMGIVLRGLTVTSCIFGHDGDWLHVPRAPGQCAEIAPAVPISVPNVQFGEVPTPSEVWYFGHIVLPEEIPIPRSCEPLGSGLP